MMMRWTTKIPFPGASFLAFTFFFTASVYFLWAGSYVGHIRGSPNSMGTIAHHGITFVTAPRIYVGPLNASTPTGIPPMSPSHTEKFNAWIAGGIVSTDFAIAEVSAWADFVFDKDYPLLPLSSVSDYIQKHGHLPGVPSHEQVKEQGTISTKDMLVVLLEKVEELTLYAIHQDELVKELQQKQCACGHDSPSTL